jgi:hypothetical protein
MIRLTESHKKQILELALMDETPHYRRKIRAILLLTQKMGFSMTANTVVCE